MNLPDNLNRMGRGPLLASHLDQLAVAPLRRYQNLALHRIVTARLLDVDMLPCLQTRDCHRSVPVIGGRDGDDIDILRFQYLPEILVLLGSRAKLLCGVSSELSQDRGVHIAHVRNPG